MRENAVGEKPPMRPGSVKIKPLTMSFSQPQLSGIASLLASTMPSSSNLGAKRTLEETRKIVPLVALHSRMQSKGSLRSLQSKSRGDYESRDGFALAEYRKQEIRRARGKVLSQHPYWFIDSWLEDEVGEKKLSHISSPRTPSASARRQQTWEQGLKDKLEKWKQRGAVLS